VTLSA